MFWICSLFVAEPDCGIPVKMWVVYYLFFRIFRNVHNIVGLLLILNNTPVYYKPVTKMIIFTTFEQFEFWWMIYGNFLFFLADNNKCKLTFQKEDCHKNSHGFLYIAMLLLVLFGLLVIANTCMIIIETVTKFGEN